MAPARGQSLSPSVASALALTILLADLVAPPGAAIAGAYLVVVAMAARLPDRRWVLRLAALCSALTLLGGLADPPGGPAVQSAANRLLVLACLWAAAALLHPRRPGPDGDALARELEHGRELQVAHGELQLRTREIDDFAYTAAHDLRAPLRGIHNYSAFLLEDFGERLDEEGRGRLVTIQKLAEHLSSLLDSLLCYSRVGRADLVLENIDLNELVEEVLDSLELGPGGGVQVSIREPLPTVRCDRAHVGEVFRQLLSNAVQYNESAEKKIEIGMANPATVFVRDNGIGIRSDHQSMIFQIFKRLHPRDAWGGGTGAGMTLIKKIVERHGGWVWLESSPGEGSTFYFTLGKKGGPHGRGIR